MIAKVTRPFKNYPATLSNYPEKKLTKVPGLFGKKGGGKNTLSHI